MGRSQSLLNYIKMVNMHETYAAEIRYEQYKKKALEGASLADKIKFYCKRKKFDITAYNMVGEIKHFNIKARTKDLAMVKFHKLYRFWVIRKIEVGNEVIFEEEVF